MSAVQPASFMCEFQYYTCQASLPGQL